MRLNQNVSNWCLTKSAFKSIKIVIACLKTVRQFCHFASFLIMATVTRLTTTNSLIKLRFCWTVFMKTINLNGILQQNGYELSCIKDNEYLECSPEIETKLFESCNIDELSRFNFCYSTFFIVNLCKTSFTSKTYKPDYALHQRFPSHW